jgi:hypothetical protein
MLSEMIVPVQAPYGPLNPKEFLLLASEQIESRSTQRLYRRDVPEWRYASYPWLPWRRANASHAAGRHRRFASGSLRLRHIAVGAADDDVCHRIAGVVDSWSNGKTLFLRICINDLWSGQKNPDESRKGDL